MSDQQSDLLYRLAEDLDSDRMRDRFRRQLQQERQRQRRQRLLAMAALVLLPIVSLWWMARVGNQPRPPAAEDSASKLPERSRQGEAADAGSREARHSTKDVAVVLTVLQANTDINARLAVLDLLATDSVSRPALSPILEALRSDQPAIVQTHGLLALDRGGWLEKALAHEQANDPAWSKEARSLLETL